MRYNAVNIQMLPERIRSRLFPSKLETNYTRPQYPKLAQKHLEQQDLWMKGFKELKEPDLDLPPLLGNSLFSHFMRMSSSTHSSYLNNALDLTKHHKIPTRPRNWRLDTPGWIRYDGLSVEKVEFPRENVGVFDTEVLVSLSNYPVMACFVSDKAWYSWLSPVIFDNMQYDSNESLARNHKHLIPLGFNPKDPKLVIGHNVSYDRARVLEEYSLIPSSTRFIDTMSLHMAVSGLTASQRAKWKKIEAFRNASATSDIDEEESFTKADYEWYSVSALNSLKDLTKFYLNEEIDKDTRDIFVEGSLQDVRENLEELMDYCATDVDKTFGVFCKVFDKFWNVKLKKNIVSFAGMLEMGSSYLPISSKWNEFIETCEKKVLDQQTGILNHLKDLANEMLKFDHDKIEEDHFARQLNWTICKRRGKSPVPRWYRDLIPSKKNDPELTIRSKITPLLLRMYWGGYPLYYLGSVYGWCYRVPKAEQHVGDAVNIETFKKEIEKLLEKSKTGTSSQERFLQIVQDDTNGKYFRLPSNSPKSDSMNCGSPFAKSFLPHFASGHLKSDDEVANSALDANSSCSYWISVRRRVINQFVISQKELYEMCSKGGLFDPNSSEGVLLPQVITMGTVTRRAVESTWLTASNAKKNRIGSELKSLVQAPKGYKIVGADVDSQELWISSLLGDAQFGIHGSTALGWMTLQGSKVDKTDLHSRSAEIIHSTRDHAKVFNYARIYGSGLKFATDLLMKHQPDISKQEAESRAKNLYKETKGTQYFSKNAKKLRLDVSAKEILKSFPVKFWYGGSESYMFNAMEQIATSKDPRTPACNVQLPDSLIPDGARKQYHPSCVNWVVQSSGVDYLHLILASMSYLIQKYNINGRLMITIHDEIRYLVEDSDADRLALALQISNIWTRAYFANQLGLNDLPLGVSFFSGIDIDDILRKEVFDKCITISNPEGAPQAGETVDIYQTIERTGGTLGKPSQAPTIIASDVDSEIYEMNSAMKPEYRVDLQEKWLKLQMCRSQPEIHSLLVKKSSS